MNVLAQLASAPRVLSVGLAAAAVLLAACSQTPVLVPLHSLGPSGNLSFICQGDDGDGDHVLGLKLDECPDYEHLDRRMLGLVTQTDTNEVAIVDLRAGAVLDIDPSTPGYSFLRVGARPGAIVSTPGGVASFVGVTGLQKNGVFALPTTCLKPPDPGQPALDVTTWAACALTSAPGDIQVLIAPSSSSCPMPTADDATSAATQDARECPADLTSEEGPVGRRKLLVALPEEHKLVLLDAQALLDRPAGEFQPCTVEASYPLQAKLPSVPVSPQLPDDLQPTDTSICAAPTQYPPAASTDPTPAGMAMSGSTLYVGDGTLPVVHVLDVSDPCSPTEQEPLQAHSYVDPNRVVTTSRVAVSPLTPSGKQFVYAIDKDDAPASVMVFDVSANSTTHAPLIYSGAPRQPFSSPDRLRFSAPVRDVTFVMRDFPEPDPTTGVGQFGLKCDPTPSIDITSAAALYRPSSDFTTGARPPNLRGVFGFLMLSNGQIPIIDVEDFDAPCRRPIFANHTDFEDFRGCKSDPGDFAYFTGTDGSLSTGAPYVTNESSCNIIETNRARALSPSISNSTVGLHAPTLSAFPQFSNPDPSSVLGPQDQPHMLAVDFANANPSGNPFPAQVNISGQLYAACPNGADTASPPCDGSALLLQNDPAGDSLQNSLTLPLVEPRSYVANELPSLTFEGRIMTDRQSGFLSNNGSEWWIQDPDAIFCSVGAEDSQSIQVEGKSLGIPAAALPAWGDAHADYVQITGDFLPDTDSYWSLGQGKTCHNADFSTATGRDACVDEFGAIDNVVSLKDTRELSIVSAFNDHLVVKARNASTVDDVHCCFPSGTSYNIRVSHQWFLSGAAAAQSDIASVGGRCMHTAACDPRKKYLHARAFEVCDSSLPTTDPTTDPDACAPTAANVGCTRAFADRSITPAKSYGAIEPTGDGSQCIFDNLTSRFVVARGQKPSSRDMTFTWGTTGGFTPLSMSLASQSVSVNPQAMSYIPELGFIGVVDGSSLGLSLFDLNSLAVVLPSPFF